MGTEIRKSKENLLKGIGRFPCDSTAFLLQFGLRYLSFITFILCIGMCFRISGKFCEISKLGLISLFTL